MQRLLAVSIALAATAAAWLSGCSARPAAVAPPHEPTPRATGSPASGDQSRGSDRGTATPTSSPKNEGPLATPTCTPLAEEESMTPQPTQGTPHETLPYEAQRVVQMAKEDLAQRLELSVSEISVISVEAVDWPDASLGCPQPGMMYAQVITRGFLVVLEATSQSYEYHTDRADQVVLCQTDGGNETAPPKGIDDSSPWQPVEPIEPDEIYPSPEP